MTTSAEATTEPEVTAEQQAKAAVMFQTVARLQENPDSNEKVELVITLLKTAAPLMGVDVDTPGAINAAFAADGYDMLVELAKAFIASGGKLQ